LLSGVINELSPYHCQGAINHGKSTTIIDSLVCKEFVSLRYDKLSVAPAWRPSLKTAFLKKIISKVGHPESSTK